MHISKHSLNFLESFHPKALELNNVDILTKCTLLAINDEIYYRHNCSVEYENKYTSYKRFDIETLYPNSLKNFYYLLALNKVIEIVDDQVIIQVQIVSVEFLVTCYVEFIHENCPPKLANNYYIRRY